MVFGGARTDAFLHIMRYILRRWHTSSLPSGKKRVFTYDPVEKAHKHPSQRGI
jgi:hypothetical protein